MTSDMTGKDVSTYGFRESCHIALIICVMTPKHLDIRLFRFHDTCPATCRHIRLPKYMCIQPVRVNVTQAR